MGKSCVMEIIRAYQGELSLSHDDIRRLERNDAFLQSVVDAVNEYMEDEDISVLSLGRHDPHTQKIIDIIDKLLDY